MRLRVRILIPILLLAFGLLLQGCVLPGRIQVTATPSPVLVTINQTPSSTIMPELSPSNTQTAASNLIPSPTPSPTNISKRVTNFVREMLETNGECDLSCWWGFTPGETSWKELETRLTAAGLSIEDGWIDLSPWKDITGHNVSVQLRRDKDIIEEIQIHCEMDPDVIFVDGMVDVCGAYALPSTLSRFGVPSQINLSMSRLDSLYDLWMTYAYPGITISYPGLMVTDVEGWYICPLHERQEQIVVYFHAPGNEPENIGFGENDGVFLASGSLEWLTGMTEGDFHTTYSFPETRSCLFADDPFQRYYEEILVAPEGNRLWPQAETDFLMEALRTNLECDLPCWWGITPGKTSWESARDKFLSLGKSIATYSDNTLNLGGVRRVSLFGRHDPYRFDYFLTHEIYEYNGFISLLGARAQTFGGQPMAGMLRDWERYTLSHILARFGNPSQVLLHYWSDDPESPYTVGLIYDRDGLLVEYEGQIKLFPEENKNGNDSFEDVVICLDEDHISGINVWVRSPRGALALDEVFKQLGGNFPKYFYSTPTLEEATGNSLDWFYEKFSEPKPETCLVVDRILGDSVE